MWCYLQWRTETYAGVPGKTVTLHMLLSLLWKYKKRIIPYVKWWMKMRYVY